MCLAKSSPCAGPSAGAENARLRKWRVWCLLANGDTPPIRNKLFSVPCKAPEGTNTQVASAKGHFCAYPTLD